MTTVNNQSSSRQTATDEVQVETKLPFSAFLKPATISEIVSSRNFPAGDWSDLCEIRQDKTNVYKRVLPIDLRGFRLMVVTKVAPGTRVPKHSHNEAIVRYIMEGSLLLNGAVYHAGDWIVVPEGFPYEIHTVEGYCAIAGYGEACR